MEYVRNPVGRVVLDVRMAFSPVTVLNNAQKTVTQAVTRVAEYVLKGAKRDTLENSVISYVQSIVKH